MKEDDLRLVQRSVTTETLFPRAFGSEDCGFQDLGAGGGGRERNPVGGPGGRVEQRPLASVASIKMVEHQETSVQPQGHPLQRYSPALYGQASHQIHPSFIVSACVCVCPVLLKGLQELMSSAQTSPGQGSPSSSSSLQIRLTRVEESSSPASSSVAALQIPVQIPLQITHLGEQKQSRSRRCGEGRC